MSAAWRFWAPGLQFEGLGLVKRALITRMGFWGILYYNHSKEPPPKKIVYVIIQSLYLAPIIPLIVILILIPPFKGTLKGTLFEFHHIGSLGWPGSAQNTTLP